MDHASFQRAAEKVLGPFAAVESRLAVLDAGLGMVPRLVLLTLKLHGHVRPQSARAAEAGPRGSACAVRSRTRAATPWRSEPACLLSGGPQTLAGARAQASSRPRAAPPGPIGEGQGGRGTQDRLWRWRKAMGRGVAAAPFHERLRVGTAPPTSQIRDWAVQVLSHPGPGSSRYTSFLSATRTCGSLASAGLSFRT
eukprot:2216263-Rhodomonas_salina.1